LTSPFHQPLQRIPTGTQFSRLKTNEDLFQAWLRDAQTRLADDTLRFRQTHIGIFLEQWGSNLVTDLSVAELRSYIEARAATCSNFRRGGMDSQKRRALRPASSKRRVTDAKVCRDLL
jgi:hypothetical protein